MLPARWPHQSPTVFPPAKPRTRAGWGPPTDGPAFVPRIPRTDAPPGAVCWRTGAGVAESRAPQRPVAHVRAALSPPITNLTRAHDGSSAVFAARRPPPAARRSPLAARRMPGTEVDGHVLVTHELTVVPPYPRSSPTSARCAAARCLHRLAGRTSRRDHSDASHARSSLPAAPTRRFSTFLSSLAFCASASRQSPRRSRSARRQHGQQLDQGIAHLVRVRTSDLEAGQLETRQLPCNDRTFRFLLADASRPAGSVRIRLARRTR